jgi:hypothetical protein
MTIGGGKVLAIHIDKGELINVSRMQLGSSGR